MELKKKTVIRPNMEKLEMLNNCKICKYFNFCFSIPNGKCLVKVECKDCGWRLADPDPCEGCRNMEFFTRVNHQYDNEI